MSEPAQVETGPVPVFTDQMESEHRAAIQKTVKQAVDLNPDETAQLEAALVEPKIDLGLERDNEIKVVDEPKQEPTAPEGQKSFIGGIIDNLKGSLGVKIGYAPSRELRGLKAQSVEQKHPGAKVTFK